MKIISITLYFLFVYWRNYCSIIQIKTYYENSELKKISNIAYNKYLLMDTDCFKNEKINRSKIYDVLNIIPTKNKLFIENILALKYCLSESSSFIENISNSISKNTLNSDMIRQSFKIEQNNQIIVYGNTRGNQIADKFDLMPFNLKESYLISTLSKMSEKNKNTFNIHNIVDFYDNVPPLKNKTTLQYIFTFLDNISNESDVIKSLKKGYYIINIVESINIELMTRLNRLMFNVKDSQNKIEYLIKQITMESTFLFVLISNYLYFLICSLLIIVSWCFILLKTKKL
jgi:hypothetical protein